MAKLTVLCTESLVSPENSRLHVFPGATSSSVPISNTHMQHVCAFSSSQPSAGLLGRFFRLPHCRAWKASDGSPHLCSQKHRPEEFLLSPWEVFLLMHFEQPQEKGSHSRKVMAVNSEGLCP